MELMDSMEGSLLCQTRSTKLLLGGVQGIASIPHAPKEVAPGVRIGVGVEDRMSILGAKSEGRGDQLKPLDGEEI